MPTPGEVATATQYAVKNVIVPTGISQLLAGRIERVLLYVETDQSTGNVNIGPFIPNVAKGGKGISTDNPGLFTYHDWGGMMQAPWFVSNANIGNITLKVLEAWIPG